MRPQRGQRRCALRKVGDEMRQQGLQAPGARLIEPAHQRGLAKFEQPPRRWPSLGEARAEERLRQRRRLAARLPELREVNARGPGFRGRARAKDHRFEVPADAAAVLLELRGERCPIGRPHRGCQRRAGALILRQAVHLLVRAHLQTVLEAPQMLIGRRQIRDHGRRQQARPIELRQRDGERRRLQPPVASATYELECLHDEFDLADAARTELDVVGKLALLHFALDQALHLAQAFKHAVIEIAPVDERAHGGGIDLRIVLDAAVIARAFT